MRRIFSFAALALVAAASSAQAQRSSSSNSSASMPIELGFDGGLSFGTGGTNNTTNIDTPLKNLRAGFLINPTWSIEPSFSLTRQSATGASSTEYAIGVGALYHFSTARTANQLYARPFVNYLGFNDKVDTSPTTTVSTSDHLTEMGAGIGMKLPWKERLVWRVEADFSHLSKKLPSGDNRVGMLFGMSYFTR
jgi:hypothetical protein